VSNSPPILTTLQALDKLFNDRPRRQFREHLPAPEIEVHVKEVSAVDWGIHSPQVTLVVLASAVRKRKMGCVLGMVMCEYRSRLDGDLKNADANLSVPKVAYQEQSN
jgi:hypothetical protein